MNRAKPVEARRSPKTNPAAVTGGANPARCGRGSPATPSDFLAAALIALLGNLGRF